MDAGNWPRGCTNPRRRKTRALATSVFSFNPVQSRREAAIGDQYFSKGNYTAAISRYDAATKWNDGNAKRNPIRRRRAAHEKYLEIMPAGKDSAEVKKRLTKLGALIH